MVLVAEPQARQSIVPFTSWSFGRMSQRTVHFFGTRDGPEYGRMHGEQGTVKAGEPDYPLVVSIRQVHGTDVLSLDRPVKAGQTFFGGHDAVLTNQAGTLLTVHTADCVPVLLMDTSRNVIGAVHAGWRGAVHGIVVKSLRNMMEQFDAGLASLHVAIGPSAGPCCYEVDTPVMDQLPPDVLGDPTILRRTGPGTGLLDLKRFIQWQARSLGLAEDHIHIVDLCTICRPDLFFSYRRVGKVHGTMVSGIMLK